MEQRITAILIDDENNSRLVLRTLLERHFEEHVEILGEASNAEEGYVLINRLQPQLVFLDIQMPKADGFSLLRRFDQVPFEIIFVTSYDQYAINAIKFSALDYLLKPVEVPDLGNSIRKAIRQLSVQQNNNLQVVNLLHSIENENDERKIAVHVADAVKLLEERSIIYVKGDGSYCAILTDTGDKYTTARYIKDFEDYFGDESLFVRINKGLLINTKKIRQYSKGEPCMIEMVNGEVFEVARRKKSEVLSKLKKF